MIESLFAVLVNWNLKDDTIACIESLRTAGMRDGQIIVVDNASDDGSVEAIENRFHETVLQIRTETNLGYTGGANLGFQEAVQRNAAWIFLLNNDTCVSPQIFTEFAKAAREWPEFDILAPVIYYSSQPKQIWYFGDRMIGNTLLTISMYRNQHEPTDLPPIRPVDFISGCGMLIRREVLEVIGFFDSSLFMYGEEIDFCWRARLKGYRSATVKGAKMWHKVSASAAKIPTQKRYFKTRNQCLFYDRYSSGLMKPVLMVYSLLRGIILGSAAFIEGVDKPILPYLRGWYDGWFRFDPGSPS